MLNFFMYMCRYIFRYNICGGAISHFLTRKRAFKSQSLVELCFQDCAQRRSYKQWTEGREVKSRLSLYRKYKHGIKESNVSSMLII